MKYLLRARVLTRIMNILSMSDQPQRPLCHHPGCKKEGLYPAPQKNNALANHLWFCLEHVRAYNAQWNYFGDLSPHEIEQEIRRATVWERPTWPFGKGPMAKKTRASASPRAQNLPKPVCDALKTLGLETTSTLKDIKAAYRALAKKFHPDANRGSKEDIEKFHAVQQAFATLQKFYAKKKKQSSE